MYEFRREIAVQMYVQVRIERRPNRKQGGGEKGISEGRSANLQAMLNAFRNRSCRLHCALVVQERQSGLLHERTTPVCQGHIGVISIEEFDSVSLFKRADMPAESGLAHSQPLGSSRKAQLFGKSHDGYEGSNVDEALHGPPPMPA